MAKPKETRRLQIQRSQKVSGRAIHKISYADLIIKLFNKLYLFISSLNTRDFLLHDKICFLNHSLSLKCNSFRNKIKDLIITFVKISFIFLFIIFNKNIILYILHYIQDYHLFYSYAQRDYLVLCAKVQHKSMFHIY